MFSKPDKSFVTEYVSRNPSGGVFSFIVDVPSKGGGMFRLDVNFSYSIEKDSLYYDYDIDFLEGFLRNFSGLQFEDSVSLNGVSAGDKVFNVISSITEGLVVI